ncbi:MAG: NADH-quinone oxidoreductase subunit N [Candidatus Micrarchaeia archaeon]
MISLVYIFILLFAILALGSMLARILNRKALLYAFSVLTIAAIAATAADFIFSGSFGIYLGILSLNPFSSLMIILFAAATILILSYSLEESTYEDFALLLSFDFIGASVVAMANSLITIFLGLELVAIPTTIMILLSRKSLEAGIKYFVITAIASSLLAFGIALVYLFSGNLLLLSQPYSVGLAFALVMFIAAIGIEASVFPFNLWVPDVYQGSPSFVTSVLGGINKKVGLIALVEVVLIMFGTYTIVAYLVAVLAILTMFYGNLGALRQQNIKRMLAYSSISQAGYIMIGLATLTSYGISASIFQIFAHIFMFVGAFAIVSWLEGKNRVNINEYVGLNSENRLAALGLSIFLLSMAGIPFTVGFVGKFLLFSSAIYANMAWLAILGIISTVISIYYYSRVIIAIYTNRAGTVYIHMHRNVAAVVAACIVIVIAFGIYPGPAIHAVESAGTYLMHG